MRSFKAILLFGVILDAGSAFSSSSAFAAPGPILWDTGSRLEGPSQIDARDHWMVVPSDLMRLEADPPKASSDPGYYGRDYSFQGDAVVENQKLVALFLAGQGRMLLWFKETPSSQGKDFPGTGQMSKAYVEVLPLGIPKPKFSRIQVVRNAGDEVLLHAYFSGEGSEEPSLAVSFDKTQVVALQSSGALAGVRVKSDLAYAVVPSFVGDDLIVDAGLAEPAEKMLSLPSESMLLGLRPGETNELVMTWPKGDQGVKVWLGEERNGTRLIEAIDFERPGQELYLAGLSASGIWHRENLDPGFLEKDVTIPWRRPFPARWKTQLREEGVRTSFALRNSKEEIWRGVPGSYNYPVWFEGQGTLFHLSKKVPPPGEAVIYCLESQDTPNSVLLPVDILKSTLGRAASAVILDMPGRRLRTHHRRGGEGVRRACTCGCTEAIQAVFEAGQEAERRSYIEGAVADMVYFVHRHVERIDEYRAFAVELSRFLEARSMAEPGLKPFIDSLQQIAAQIPQECENQKENMKSFEYADELSKKTMALTGQDDTNHVKAYMELLKAWREMGGAQDYVLAKSHMIARSLFQEAGYGALHQPEAAVLAREVRQRCRECLRNPDGYEIWSDY